MKKTLVIIILILAAFIVGGFIFINNYIYQQKQVQNRPVPTDYQGTLTGQYVCLPHKDKEGPQTLECALGLKTDAGSYYSLDFGDMPPDWGNVGEQMTVSGTIVPIEALSAIQKYDIEGVMRVKSISKPK